MHETSVKRGASCQILQSPHRFDEPFERYSVDSLLRHFLARVLAVMMFSTITDAESCFREACLARITSFEHSETTVFISISELDSGIRMSEKTHEKYYTIAYRVPAVKFFNPRIDLMSHSKDTALIRS